MNNKKLSDLLSNREIRHDFQNGVQGTSFKDPIQAKQYLLRNIAFSPLWGIDEEEDLDETGWSPETINRFNRINDQLFSEYDRIFQTAMEMFSAGNKSVSEILEEAGRMASEAYKRAESEATQVVLAENSPLFGWAFEVIEKSPGVFLVSLSPLSDPTGKFRGVGPCGDSAPSYVEGLVGSILGGQRICEDLWEVQANSIDDVRNKLKGLRLVEKPDAPSLADWKK